jgi:thiamine biosynthesis protein ThiI
MIIVRYGEIGLKSPQTRRVMEKKLLENIRTALDGKELSREHGRMFVESDSIEDARKVAGIFGVVSTSLALKTSSNIDNILAVGESFATERLAEGKTFAVRARRKGRHAYRSTDLAVKLGSVIEDKTGAKVNLKNPEVTVYVEVRDGDAYLFDEVIQGVGGLPLGTQGRALALISGGIDSPVAAWMMMKRGVEIIALFMDCRPLVDDRTIDRAVKTIEVLSGWAYAPIKTHVAPYGDALLEFLKYENHKLGCVLCKRMMYYLALEIAKKEKAQAIVTGDSLGQVASQTIENLSAVEQGVDLPILRPLISMDKTEIIEVARKIGTYEISILPANCCLGPPIHPETRATTGKILRAEKKLKMESLLDEALQSTEIREVGNGKGRKTF